MIFLVCFVAGVLIGLTDLRFTYKVLLGAVVGFVVPLALHAASLPQERLRAATLHLRTGTGSLVQGPSGKTYILTNWHVCLGSKWKNGEVIGAFPDGSSVTGHIVKESSQYDLCAAEVDGASALKVSRSSVIPARVHTRGYPEGTLTETSGVTKQPITWQFAFPIEELGECPRAAKSSEAPTVRCTPADFGLPQCSRPSTPGPARAGAQWWTTKGSLSGLSLISIPPRSMRQGWFFCPTSRLSLRGSNVTEDPDARSGVPHLCYGGDCLWSRNPLLGVSHAMSDEQKPIKKWGGKREKLVIDELLTRQVASLLASGANNTQIANELQISATMVRKISAMPETKAMLKEVGESALAGAKALIRQRTAKLAEKIVDVIEAQLAEGNLDAVKIGLKVLGFSDQEQVVQGAQNLTVVLPGASASRPAIEVESE